MLDEDLKFYTPAEIAELIGFKKRTIVRWLQTGKLRGIKIGKQWRVRHKDFAEFLEQQSHRRES